METTYKFWYVTRDDDIHISKVAVRFYEGNPNTEDEIDIADGALKSITRFRFQNSTRLTEADLAYTGDTFGKDIGGNDVSTYTDADFGVITSDDELRLFLNKELAKDPIRTPVDGQKEVLDIGKVK